MTTLHLTQGVLRQIEEFNSNFNEARFGVLANVPGNPLNVELRRFGNALAVKNRSPLLRGKQRVTGFRSEDTSFLAELLDWYRGDALCCAIQVGFGEESAPLFHRMIAAGLMSSGSGAVPVLRAGPEPFAAPAGLTIRDSPPTEREKYLDLFQRCFAGRSEQKPDYRAMQWAEDSAPGARRFVAELEGEPVGMAALFCGGAVACCTTAGTLAELRGRGIQQALLRHRIAEARRAGCSVILGGAAIGSTPYRNFERAGFRATPLGMSWTDPPR